MNAADTRARDFFLASTGSRLTGSVHLRTGAALVPAFSVPLPDGNWRIVYGPPLQVELTGDRRQDVLRVTQACTKVLEEQIRREPRCWLWMHRRWKTQPEPTLATDGPRGQTG